MKNNATATLANFNCTIKDGTEVIPMLNFFEHIVYPALNNSKIYKQTKRNKYYISDLKVIKLENGPFALVGKHIKKTILDIYPDYNAEEGFIGEQSSAPSAPDSNFILLLNNHRLIYYSSKSGAPTISSFSSTIKYMINDYVSKQRSTILNLIKELSPKQAIEKGALYKNETNNKNKYFRYEYDGEFYKNIIDFKIRYLDVKFPFPETNIIPIESQALIEEAFNNIKKIKKVEFKFYKPNNDVLDFDSIFEQSYSILEKSNSTSVKTVLNSPEEISVVKSAINSSNGKTSYKIDATSKNDEPIQLIPDKVSEKVIITVENSDNIENESASVYNQVKDKTAVKEISDDNESLYLKMKAIISSLM